jgi:two-component system sporulation sensor kinase C
MDINMLIEETMEKLSPLLEENHIKLNLKLIDDEIYIYGDYNRLSQVLINIIKNSIESVNHKGNIIIESKLKNNKCYLSIKDNGCGMNKEVLEKIKEPFFTTKSRGSGLGCALIHEIIEAHDAKINYSSEIGKGTTVNLIFSIYQ